MLPITGRVRQGTLNIPTLDGGVNWRDFGETVNDNQLTDAVNVREKGGLLQTRHRIKDHVESKKDVSLYETVEGSVFQKTKLFPDIVIDGRIFGITIIAEKANVSGGIIGSTASYDKYGADGSVIHIGDISFGSVGETGLEYRSMFAAYFNGYILVYHYFNKYAINENRFQIVKVDTAVGTVSKINDSDIYVPTVVLNGMPGTLNDNFLTGDFNEGYNLIGNYAKAIYSSYDYKNNPASSKAAFTIPVDFSTFNSVGMTFTGVHYKKLGDGTVSKTVHTCTVTGTWPGTLSASEGTVQSDGWSMYVNHKTVCFISTNPSDDYAAEQTSADFLKDNIEITFPVSSAEEAESKALEVFGMQTAEWFGGTASGISGGTRLFIAGTVLSSSEKNESLLRWSDINNPLYFPENNYAYVGDRGQRINALARQGEALVILKDRETYMSVYRQSTAPTAENVINHDFVDLTTANAYFPMISVNSKIGCDSPDTVQLCNNRLVWASDVDKKVYTLVTNDQFSENTILDVSGMVDSRFGNINMNEAKSADFDGMYMLFCDNEVFCMDYQSYGFSNLSYYQRYDAEKRIPWWNWRIPHKVANASVIGDKFIGTFEAIMLFGTGYRVISIPVTLTEEETHDTVTVLPSSFNGAVTTEAVPVENMIASKKYSFGAQTVYKSIPCVRAEFSSGSDVDESSALIITFTADGKYHDEYQTHIIEGVDEFVNRTIRPRIRAARRFDFVLTYYGVLRVGNIEITYQVCGGAK